MNKTVCVLMLAVSASAMANKTISIHPSGDTSGIIDKFNIEAAIGSANDNETLTIKLEKGNFYINEGIRFQNFKGKLSGNSPTKTKLIAVA